jgi:hypothetical protein
MNQLSVYKAPMRIVVHHPNSKAFHISHPAPSNNALAESAPPHSNVTALSEFVAPPLQAQQVFRQLYLREWHNRQSAQRFYPNRRRRSVTRRHPVPTDMLSSRGKPHEPVSIDHIQPLAGGFPGTQPAVDSDIQDHDGNDVPDWLPQNDGQHDDTSASDRSDDDYDSSDDFSDDSSEPDESNIEQEPHVHTSIFPEHDRPEDGLLKSSCEPLCVFINSEQAIMQDHDAESEYPCISSRAHAIYHSQFSFWQVALLEGMFLSTKTHVRARFLAATTQVWQPVGR